MVDFYDLTNAKADVLTGAADAWDQIVTKLTAMDAEWNSVVVAKVNGSGWSGKAADQAKPALSRGNDQLAAAATEAGAIASVLREAAGAIQDAKTKIDAALADAKSAGLTVSSDGTVSWPPADHATRRDPQAAQDYDDRYGPKADDIRTRIDSAVQAATDADQRACFALRSDVSSDKDGSFNAQAIGAGPAADARRAAQLAAKGNKLSDTELLELNNLLHAYGGDPVFSTKFYENLGPKGLLTSWNSMVDDEDSVTSASDARWAQYQEMQKNLGTALATATRTTNQPHLSDQWEADLRKAGAQPLWDLPSQMIYRPYVPYGYQVLSGILRTGDYDPHFLDPIAEHIVQLDASHKIDWPSPGLTSNPERRGFNILGLDGGAGIDPVTGVLEALGHSPEAATSFFENKPTAYNADGTVNPNGTPNPPDYLHYLAHDKEFTTDTLSQQGDLMAKGLASGPTALGHALEAATSGQPYDAAPAQSAQHTPGQADVMNKVMTEFGENTGGSLARITGPNAPLAALRPSLGHMTADYMGDVQRAMSPWDQTLPVNGTPANLQTPDVRAVLNVLGRDPQAYGSVINAQQAYTTALIHGAFAGGETDTAKLAIPAENAAASGGMVAGVLNQARADAVFKAHEASDQAYNQGVQQGSWWVKTTFSATIGALAGETPGVSAGSDFIVDQILQSVVGNAQQDTIALAQEQAGQLSDAGRNADAISAAQAVRDAAVGTGLANSQVEQLAALVGHQAAAGEAVGGGANRTANGG
ncbi:hypothetical protein [Kitasatospora kifunensis]|uniref:Uncharacterized protein n=1 Tax=Kitasatospora kifunensis TaxID=58351 RepID=A0A7W7QYZ3_KITKI|nr:hypothetical protein [Kitasatospora kifunensis]MBB4922412.1 hypothetical protein [Kitasatospora kifunensis]